MPKALSGEMLADPIVLTDKGKHHSFDRRVKALGAQSTCSERNSLRHAAASYGEPARSDARSRRSC
jgi:hypothetical protein